MLLIILGILCFSGALLLLFTRETLAPAASLAGLVAVYFSGQLPLAPNMVITWVALTVIVMGATLMQPRAVMMQNRGMGYMLIGAITGMVTGLSIMSASDSLTLKYACMITGIPVGIFMAFLLFTRTPAGKSVNIASGRFFNYLTAKGFPLAITVIQPGIVIMLKLITASSL